MTTETDREALVASPDTQLPGPRTSRRRRRRWPAVVVVVAVAALGTGGWYVIRGRDGSDSTNTSSGLPPATATVTRQALRETQQVDGTLGYGTVYQLASPRKGVVTWLPAEGSTVSRGQPLYTIDNVSVPLLYGSLPLYRTLRDGADDGPDVLELESNLAALGYGGFTVDVHYSDTTADAVAQWQSDNGWPDTGVVKVGDAVVLPATVRISEQKAQIGDSAAPGKPLFAYTNTTRTVTVPLDVADQQLAKVGEKVTVELPDGTDTAGTISSVGTVAQAAPSSSSGTSGATSSDATITVTVTLDRPNSAGTLDQAPVGVNFVSAQRKNVLTVPIAALLALAGGGYGVQVVDGEATRIVAVKTGLFGDTRVEVSGSGLTAGMKVGVPKQ
jgi:membrane fusion protein, multidrug efflux system